MTNRKCNRAHPDLDAPLEPLDPSMIGRGVATMLWRDVIAQAIADATCDAASCKDAEVYRHRARSWLASKSQDFAMVCDFADVDRGALQRAADKVVDLDLHKILRSHASHIVYMCASNSRRSYGDELEDMAEEMA